MKTLEENNLSKNEEQESFVPLAKEIIHHGFIYRLVERNDYKALYSQSFKHSSYVIAHELFYVVKEYRKLNPRTEERALMEAFPSNCDFGKKAWSITRDSTKALDRYNKMERRGGNE